MLKQFTLFSASAALMTALGCATPHGASTEAPTEQGVVAAEQTPWAWEDSGLPDREPKSVYNVPGGIITNGKLKAEGEVGQFTLPSELHIIPQPMKPVALHTADLKKNQIAITIDDGPSPENDAFVLKTLKEHGVKATFFLVGQRIKARPDLVKNILRDGHSIAVHTWSHPQMDKISLAAAAKEIDSTNDLLQKIVAELNQEDHRDPENLYRVQPFFRFPYGEGANDPKLQALLQARNLANFHWSMTSKDSEIKSDGSVCLNTEVGMLDKYNYGLFLTHETHPSGVKALPYFLEQLHNRGYTTVYYQAALKPAPAPGAAPAPAPAH